MSYQKILVGEISSLIDNLIDGKIIIDPNAVTSEICNNHSKELLNDATFSTYNNYTNVRREVRSVMSKKMDLDINSLTNENSQLVIIGFECLQSYYSIKRNDSYLGVPIEEMTVEEIRQKAKSYRKMGNTCYIHADELDKYCDNKRDDKAA